MRARRTRPRSERRRNCAGATASRRLYRRTTVPGGEERDAARRGPNASWLLVTNSAHQLAVVGRRPTIADQWLVQYLRRNSTTCCSAQRPSYPFALARNVQWPPSLASMKVRFGFDAILSR